MRLFGFILWLGIAVTSAQEDVKITDWGTLKNGESVKFITLRRGAASLKIATLGAQITELNVPLENGKHRNVVLGHPDLTSAETQGTLGAAIGRYANRISQSGFTIDGTRYDLESVNPKTGIQIHGGRTGFQRQNWEIETAPESAGFKPTQVAITLKHFSPSGHEGFPGNVTVWVQYRLANSAGESSEKNKSLLVLEMEFRAKTDAPTHINLTNHAYFNLAGEGTIENQAMTLHCPEYLEFDDRNIPTGKVLPVENTRFDFRKQKLFTTLDESTRLDHCFVVPPDGEIGHLTLPGKNDLTMSIFTNQPGVQIYTANHFKGNPFPKYGAICFETQHYPDTPNRPEFPSTLLRPGEWLTETTRYFFSRSTKAQY
ncbi:MAG: galactose mutarotase [Verrucomicrobiales bacterium]|nr:galactose mutarotase [Verrucomicrobiales bacterium]